MSIQALEQFGTDGWEDAYHNGAYHEQMMALFQIHSIRPVEVAEERQKKLDYMLIIGQVIDMAYPLIDQVMFLLVQNSENFRKYETTVRNTTEVTYEWFLFEVDLLDENGKVIDTETAKVDWWTPSAAMMSASQRPSFFSATARSTISYVSFVFLMPGIFCPCHKSNLLQLATCLHTGHSVGAVAPLTR